MAHTDKVGYLYAIWIEKHTGKYGDSSAGFFGRRRQGGGSSQFIGQTICPDVLWASQEEAYGFARRGGQLPDGTPYRYYEFAYVMTSLDETASTASQAKKK